MLVWTTLDVAFFVACITDLYFLFVFHSLWGLATGSGARQQNRQLCGLVITTSYKCPFIQQKVPVIGQVAPKEVWVNSKIASCRIKSINQCPLMEDQPSKSGVQLSISRPPSKRLKTAVRLNEGGTYSENLWEKLKKGEVVQRSEQQEKKLKDLRASKFRLLHVTTT